MDPKIAPPEAAGNRPVASYGEPWTVSTTPGQVRTVGDADLMLQPDAVRLAVVQRRVARSVECVNACAGADPNVLRRLAQTVIRWSHANDGDSTPNLNDCERRMLELAAELERGGLTGLPAFDAN